MNTIQRTIYIILILVIGSTCLQAQTAKLKRAKKYMDDLNYISAIEVYNQILAKKDVAEAKINLAECYRKIGDPFNAEYWYAQVVRLPEAQPEHKLFYGMALQRNGKCNLAKPWFQEFIKAVPNDVRGTHLARACDYEKELLTKNAGIYQIKNLPFNSDLDDFSPAMNGDLLVFSSDRDRGAAVKREHSWTGSPFNELYQVKVENTTEQPGGEKYTRPTKFSSDLNTKYHDAAVSFSPDGSEIYYTRNNYVGRKLGKDDKGVTRLKVFVANPKGEGHWSSAIGLPFNSDEYSVAHPCLSHDGGKLYFASDMPGGFGGMDLYYAEYENGTWGPPINMGNRINTEGNEIFPTWHGENTLYFSSDGHIGLGGLDIYRVKWMEEDQKWTEVENIGAPINSNSDDLGIVLNEEGTFGYFSSDRSGGQGRDDIYSFIKISAPLEVYVYDEQTGKPIKGASVTHSCAEGERTTGKDGLIAYEIKLNSCCDFTAAFNGYDNASKQGCTAGITNVPVKVEIPLRRSIQIALQGFVYDDETGQPVPNATVSVTSDCDGEDVDPVLTDDKGFYSLPLRRDCCYRVRADKTGYMAATRDSICTWDFTEDIILDQDLFLLPITRQTLSQNDRSGGEGGPKRRSDGTYVDEEGNPFTGVGPDGRRYKDGRPVGTDKPFQVSPTPSMPGEPIAYLLHIYYDFDKSNIRDEAIPELEKLLTLLNDNPNIIVELASHTDARGSHRYNTRLSQRRAEAAVEWLLAKGISLDRLVPRGYGETVPVNDCVNNIPCNERKHQMNRRTEFRVLGCIGCVDPETAKLSKPNENTRVDECKSCPF